MNLVSRKKNKAYNCLYKVTIINQLNIYSAKEQWMDMDLVTVFELHSTVYSILNLILNL
jgi:hypothetical protein